MGDVERAAREAMFRQNGWWRDEPLQALLDRWAARTPHEPALLHAGGAISFAELQGKVGAFAAGLHALGIGPGDAVAVQLPNIAEFVIAHFAIARCRAAMQTVHMPYGPAEIGPLLRHSGAKAAIVLGKFKDASPASMFLGLRHDAPALRDVIAVGAPAEGALNFNEVAASVDVPPTGSVATDPYLLLYTSGTTSSPKGVRVTHNHFLSNARLCADQFGLGPDDRMMCAAPFTHLYGLYSLNLAFSSGATSCLLPVFTPPDFVAALKSYQPTALLAGPAHIAACLQNNLLKPEDVAELKFAVLSGSAVPPQLSAAFEQLMPKGKVMQAWGMTELQFGACSRHEDSPAQRFESIGRATPGTELRVVSPEGAALPPGEVGELQIRGCSLFNGYLDNPAANENIMAPGGWFRTGDLATIDADGYVRLAGRTKELINRGGIKFNPVDVEVALAAHPAVADIAIVPMPDPVLGEKACAVVVLRPGQVVTLAELTAWLDKAGIAKLKWPERLEVVNEMPLTPTRKIMKGALAKRLFG